MTSCTIASNSELGPTFGRALGIANEVRGIGIDLNTDMRDLRDRYDRGLGLSNGKILCTTRRDSIVQNQAAVTRQVQVNHHVYDVANENSALFDSRHGCAVGGVVRAGDN